MKTSKLSSWFSVTVCIALQFAASCLGQSVEDVENRFQVVGYGNSFFEGLKYQLSNEEVVELQFAPDRRSRRYRLPQGRRSISFFIEELDEAGKMKRVVQAEASIDLKSQLSLLVFVFKDEPEDKSLPYSVTTLDESESVFGPGDYRILNLTGVLVRGQLGETLFDADPGISSGLSLPLRSEVAQPIRFAIETSYGWKVVHSTKIRANQQSGTLFVLKPPLDERTLRVRVEKLW